MTPQLKVAETQEHRGKTGTEEGLYETKSKLHSNKSGPLK